VRSRITPTQNKSTSAAKKKSVKKSPPPQRIELPEFLGPELATLVSEPPAGEWLYEVKFDGYRILARVEDGEVRLFTRNNNDWTAKLPLQAKAIEDLGLGDSWLDGEVVVLDENGLPDFQALQNAFDIGRSNQVIYYLFDAPVLNGADLRELPLEERRAQLEKILPKNKKSLLRFSGAFTAHHETVLASACAMSLEGVIGKRVGSPYVSRRSGDWIKLKCRLRQEFVIVGYTSPQGSRSGFGALLLAVHEQLGKADLRYAGRVGTGFNESRLQEIYSKMAKLARTSSPLAHKLSGAQARDVHWIEPKLVCEVEFAQWTAEGILRQAAFISLRSDKPAKDIVREQAKSPAQLPSPERAAASEGDNTNTAKKTVAKKSSSGKPIVNSVAISHPERVIDPESGATKEALALFYSSVADWILPHLNYRPVSLVRAPDGITGEQFFQKHADKLAIPHIKQLDRSIDPGHPALMEIDTPEALIVAIQMGTIELHTWGAMAKAIERPDRITLDLDPDPALPWRSVVEATRLTLAVLDELKLDAWLKTTGGKGIHAARAGRGLGAHQRIFPANCAVYGAPDP
jgi:bifunctional non-homologous end joining protein LigD